MQVDPQTLTWSVFRLAYAPRNRPQPVRLSFKRVIQIAFTSEFSHKMKKNLSSVFYNGQDIHGVDPSTSRDLNILYYSKYYWYLIPLLSARC